MSHARTLVLSCLLPVCILAASPATAGAPAGGEWIDLFNGTDLTGWEGDPGIWRVEDGYILGDGACTDHKGYKSYLINRAHVFKDFVLEAEFNMSSGNSGVNYRCHDHDRDPKKKYEVSGYQADIAGGGLWDIYTKSTKRRYNVRRATGCSVKRNDWNTMRVVADGRRITHEFNGAKCLEFVDNDGHGGFRESGFIALEFHDNGTRIKFRNIRVRRLGRPAAPAASARSGGGPKRPSNSGGSPEVALWPVGEAPGQKSGKPRVKPGWLNGIYDPWMSVHLPPKEKATGAAVVICPGGGYSGLAYNHEGIQIAQWLNSHGVAGFVLRYRHNPHRHPVPLGDARRAVRIVRTRAREWGVDPRRIGIMGFSAGGHLAASAATHFDDGRDEAEDAVDRASSRPDFAVLIYPVISMKKGVTHGGSRNNLLGRDPDEKLVKLMSNELQVTERTPPSFLVHSTSDRAVPVANSRLFHEACGEAGVPSELHVYKQGGHGYGMGRKGHDAAEWPARCVEWMKARKLLDRK
jgi:acetyl esterase/lipase